MEASISITGFMDALPVQERVAPNRAETALNSLSVCCEVCGFLEDAHESAFLDVDTVLKLEKAGFFVVGGRALEQY